MMDGVEDEEIYRQIFDSVEGVEGAYNPHRIRVRKLSQYYLIALDIEVDGKQPLDEAHKIAVQVEESIKKNIPNVYDILVHVEPRGNLEPDEAFGVSQQNI
jgi:divalent metal cation (Fe/Co/Zn/Cd) transporter